MPQREMSQKETPLGEAPHRETAVGEEAKEKSPEVEELENQLDKIDRYVRKSVWRANTWRSVKEWFQGW